MNIRSSFFFISILFFSSICSQKNLYAEDLQGTLYEFCEKKALKLFKQFINKGEGKVGSENSWTTFCSLVHKYKPVFKKFFLTYLSMVVVHSGFLVGSHCNKKFFANFFNSDADEAVSFFNKKSQFYDFYDADGINDSGKAWRAWNLFRDCCLLVVDSVSPFSDKQCQLMDGHDWNLWAFSPLEFLILLIFVYKAVEFYCNNEALLTNQKKET